MKRLLTESEALWIRDEMLARLRIPSKNPQHSYIVGITRFPGPGSGATTLARKLTAQLPGTIHLQANSVRYLISKLVPEARWGENIGTVIRLTADALLSRDYALIVDGTLSDQQERHDLEAQALQHGIPVRYIHIWTDTMTAKAREKAKYDDASWVSSFEEFQVNTTTAMLKNIDELAAKRPQQPLIEGGKLIKVINNNGSQADLVREAAEVVSSLNAG